MKRVAVLGAGSWGTALAIVLAEKGHTVNMWERDEEKAIKMESDRENKRLLPNIKFPKSIKVSSNLNEVLEGVEYIVFSVPSQALREVVEKVSEKITDNMILMNTAKGIEVKTGKSLSEVMKDEIKGKYHKNIIILSGPTHAEEVAQKLPSTIVAVGELERAKKVQELFSTEYFRVYVSQDIVGAEIGGAVKNCLAIGAGIIDGMGYGDNAKAALVTRGIAEMIRFGKALGADEKTFTGLTGIGDLIVTCASKHSRNRYVGEQLGKGEKIEDILNSMVMVAEGIPTVKAIHTKITELGIEMPIVEAIYQIVYEGANPKEKVKELMKRDLKEEF